MRYAALALLMLCGCLEPKEDLSEVRQNLDDYIGRPKAEIFLEQGAPKRVVSDGKGGEILVYEYNILLQYVRVSLYADEEGIIYFWRAEGSNIPAMVSKKPAEESP